MQIKIGQIYKVKPEFKDVCALFNFAESDAKYVRYFNLENYEILDENKKIIHPNVHLSCLKPEHLEPLEKTLYNLEIGDEVEKDSIKTKILGLIESDPENQVYVISNSKNNKSVWGIFTARELEEKNIKVVQPKPTEEIKVEVTTKTLSEIKYDKKTAEIILSAFHDGTRVKITEDKTESERYPENEIFEVITKEEAEDTINKLRKGMKVKIQD